MMKKENKTESFADFIQSFFYGSRSDLSFKFLAEMKIEEASVFIQDLFKDLMDTMDDNDLLRLKDRILAGQIMGYSEQKNFEYEHGPFQILDKPLSSMKLSLLTSSGHFLKGCDPKPLGIENMTQKQAEDRVSDFIRQAPELSFIPFDTAPEDLMVRHGGYDIRGAIKDPNVSFPYQKMVCLKDHGLFRELTKDAYSFVGACSQKGLLKKILPIWVNKFKSLDVDAMVLVPV